MATDLEVKINDTTVQALSVNFQNKSINQGHKTFTMIVDNKDNHNYTEGGTCPESNDVVTIFIGTIEIFRGIIDSIKHQLDYKSKWDWMDYLRIAGRDNSFELAGYKYTKTFPTTYTFATMIQHALSDTGCPISLVVPSGSPPQVGGHTIQDGYLLDLVRDLLNKANFISPYHDWYGDIDAGSHSLNVFDMTHSSLETNITLTDVLGIPNLIEADGLEIRNYIEVLGAAILSDPEDQDAWTESLTNWSSDGQLYLETVQIYVGDAAIGIISLGSEYDKHALTKYAKEFNLLYGQNIALKFMAKTDGTGGTIYPDISKVRLYTTDTAYFEADFDLTSAWNTWKFFNYSLGPNQEFNEEYPDKGGVWTKVGDADWFNLMAIGFYTHYNQAGPALIIDGLFLEPARPRGFAENTDSQDDYGKREITIVNDDLTTQAQVDAEATSKLQKLKNPATFIPHVICRGIDFIVGGVFKALPARFVTLNLPNLEFLDGKYRMENIVVNIVPYQDLNSGYDFTVEFDGIPSDTLVDADRFYKTTKGRIEPKDKNAKQ